MPFFSCSCLNRKVGVSSPVDQDRATAAGAPPAEPDIISHISLPPTKESVAPTSSPGLPADRTMEAASDIARVRFKRSFAATSYDRDTCLSGDEDSLHSPPTYTLASQAGGAKYDCVGRLNHITGKPVEKVLIAAVGDEDKLFTSMTLDDDEAFEAERMASSPFSADHPHTLPVPVAMRRELHGQAATSHRGSMISMARPTTARSDFLTTDAVFGRHKTTVKARQRGTLSLREWGFNEGSRSKPSFVQAATASIHPKFRDKRREPNIAPWTPRDDIPSSLPLSRRPWKTRLSPLHATDRRAEAGRTEVPMARIIHEPKKDRET